MRSQASARTLLFVLARGGCLFAIPAHLLLAACFTARGEERALAECSLQFVSEGYKRIIVVPVRFGKAEYRFELDTGASSTTFGRHMRGLLRRAGDHTSFATPNGIARMRNYRASQGYIAGMALPPFKSVVLADMPNYGDGKEVRLDGALGIDALRGFIVQLDFDQRKVRFLSSVPPASGKRTSLVRKGTIPVIRGTVGRSETLLFILDTGGGCQLAIPQSIFSKCRSRGGVLEAGTTVATSKNGTFRSRIGALNIPFCAGGYRHIGLAVMDLPEPDLPPDLFPSSLIGLEYLSRYTVTFDFPGSAVYLKPGNDFNILDPPLDLMGLRLSRSEGRVTVLSVAEGSRLAALARAGDVLVSVNGADASAMSDAQVVQAITDRGRDRKLNFRRDADGETWWMSYPPADPPPARNDGANESTKVIR